MTNGTITKAILKAAKTQSGDALLYTASNLMNRFPLSSYKLLYDSDKAKVTPEAWEVLIQAALRTDERKLKGVNQWLAEAGIKKLDKEFGRFKVGKAGK